MKIFKQSHDILFNDIPKFLEKEEREPIWSRYSIRVGTKYGTLYLFFSKGSLQGSIVYIRDFLPM